ncbi:MAG: ABC transporter permease [Dehalococcoidia bacterium]
MAARGAGSLEETLAVAAEEYRPFWVTWWHGARDFVVKKPLGAFGAFIILSLLIVAIFADVIAPFNFREIFVGDRLEDPSGRHFLGTDELGRDIFSRIIRGARVTVTVGFGAVAISALVATAIGTLSGYFGGWVDSIIQRVVDAWMSIPSLVVLITVVRIFDPSLTTVTIAIGVSLSGAASRVSRSAVLAIKGNQYMEAAQAIGANDLRIIRRYVLPNIFAPILIVATVQLGFAILIEATLSFLGFGVPPPEPSWGAMVGGTARSYALQQPLLSFWPGLFIFLVVYAFNMFGDGIRDVLDPRLRGAR